MFMKKENIPHVVLAAIALCGVIMLVFSTEQGPGVGGDATIYFAAARNLLEGRGVGLIGPRGEFRLTPYDPPLFPMLLSLFGLVSIDMVAAAQWLNVLLFAAIILLVGETIYHLARSTVLSLSAALLVMASPVLVPLYSWAMTEPLSCFLGFGGLVLLLLYFREPRRWWAFAASTLTAGLAFVTHYKSVPFLVAGAAGVFLLSRKPWLSRLGRSALYCVLGFVPMGAWLWYSVSMTSGVASRRFETGAGMMGRVSSLGVLLRDAVLFWFIPDSWISAPPYPYLLNRLLLSLFTLVMLAWCAAVGWKIIRRVVDREEVEGRLRLSILLALFTLGHLAMVVITYIIIYPPITVNIRMLSPVHLAVLWLVVVLLSLSRDLFPITRAMNVVVAAGAVVLLVWYGWRTFRIVRYNYAAGMGFQSVEWKQSETLRQVRNLPEGTLIVTNEELVILFLLDRPSYPLAEIYLNEPLAEFTMYGDGELVGDTAQRTFREEGAALVLFDAIYDQLELIYGEDIDERVITLTEGLEKVFEGKDGAIYYYPSGE